MCKGLDAKLVAAAVVTQPVSDSLLSELRTALSTALTAPDLQQSQSHASKAFVMAAQQLLGDIDDAVRAISIRRGEMVNTGPSGAAAPAAGFVASHVDRGDRVPYAHDDWDNENDGIDDDNDDEDNDDDDCADSLGDAVAERNVGRETSGEAVWPEAKQIKLAREAAQQEIQVENHPEFQGLG